MDTLNINTKSKKGTHLNYDERMTIQIRLQDGWSAYKIAKELGRASNTIRNEIKRGTVSQKIHGKTQKVYFADTGDRIYTENRENSKKKYKRLECIEFINFVEDKFFNNHWSLDACFGYALNTGLFERSEMVCTKTLYNYVDQNLIGIKNTDLPEKLKRNTKRTRMRKNKKNLGKSIEERPEVVETRDEFGHWEIDTVEGIKSKEDSVVLTLLERKTRNGFYLKIQSQTSEAVMNKLSELKVMLGDKFDQVFKSITSDNGSEFAELNKLTKNTRTEIYFTHPYSSYERGTNERHNGLLRRFIPKGKSISDYSHEEIAFIGDWINGLPRKILGYKTPEELFEEELEIIYSA